MIDKRSQDISVPSGLAHEVRGGIDIMMGLSVTFVGLARDCQGQLPCSLSLIDDLGSCFASYYAAFDENDSEDDTAAILESWAAGRENIAVCTGKRGAKRWPSKRIGERGTYLATCRNRCAQLARPFIERSDVVICVDPDLGRCLNQDGLATTFYHWGTWDVVASNGLRRDKEGWVQADAWPFRQNSWSPMSFREVKDLIYAPGEPWVRLLSAFGGLACYRSEAYASSWYGGGDTEHVPFHRDMRRAGYGRFFLNPSQVVIQPRRKAQR